MEKESKKESEPEEVPGNLSSDFLNVIEEQQLRDRARQMVDAMLEVDSSIDPDKAFNEALASLKEEPPKEE